MTRFNPALFLAFFFLSPFLATEIVAAPYKIDAAHSTIQFKIRHLGISNVTGTFKTFDGTFDFDEKTNQMSNVKVAIETNSINTNENDRDNHLRGEDFFDAAKNPRIEFTGTKVEHAGKKPKKILGELTMHGQKKPLTFDVDFKGLATDPWGNQKMGFEAKSKLNRKDYGLNWNKTLDKGGLLVGEEVTILVEAEAAPVTKKQ